MSTSVCLKPQSCFEPWLVEGPILRLELAQATSHFSEPSNPPLFDSDLDQTQTQTHLSQAQPQIKTKNEDLTGWSFLQVLSNPTHSPQEVNDEDKAYVHPLVRRSASMLSEKSLEMCTESLGSETGSNLGDSSDEFSTLLSDTEKSPPQEAASRALEYCVSKKMSRAESFPPPLTTISSCGVQVKQHREEGRLVIKAVVNVESAQRRFMAEREDGRLRLHFFNDDVDDDDGENDGDDDNDNDDYDDDDDGSDYDDDDDDDDDGSDVDEEDMERNSGNVKGRLGVRNFRRSCRCKEGGRRKDRFNWEPPFWVATS